MTTVTTSDKRPRLLFDGALVDRERITRGLTPTQLAALVGYSEASYRGWVREETVPNAHAVAGMAFHLGVDICALFRPVEDSDLTLSDLGDDLSHVVRNITRRRRLTCASDETELKRIRDEIEEGERGEEERRQRRALVRRRARLVRRRSVP